MLVQRSESARAPGEPWLMRTALISAGPYHEGDLAVRVMAMRGTVNATIRGPNLLSAEDVATLQALLTKAGEEMQAITTDAWNTRTGG